MIVKLNKKLPDDVDFYELKYKILTPKDDLELMILKIEEFNFALTKDGILNSFFSYIINDEADRVENIADGVEFEPVNDIKYISEIDVDGSILKSINSGMSFVDKYTFSTSLVYDKTNDKFILVLKDNILCVEISKQHDSDLYKLLKGAV